MSTSLSSQRQIVACRRIINGQHSYFWCSAKSSLKTVFSETRLANPRLFLLWVLFLGFKHINKMFCDNSPSAAPSVHRTERAARPFQQRLNSVIIDSCHSPSRRCETRRQKVRGFDSHFLISMRYCLTIVATFQKLSSTWYIAAGRRGKAASLTATTAI